jgi:hypothetical protein
LGLSLSGGKEGSLFRFSGLSSGTAGKANYNQADHHIWQDLVEFIEPSRFGGPGNQLGLHYSSGHAASTAIGYPVEAVTTTIASPTKRKRYGICS